MPDHPAALLPPEKWRHLRWHWIDTPSGLEPWMWVDDRWLPAGCKFPFEMETYTGCVYRSVCVPAAFVPDPENVEQINAATKGVYEGLGGHDDFDAEDHEMIAKAVLTALRALQ